MADRATSSTAPVPALRLGNALGGSPVGSPLGARGLGSKAMRSPVASPLASPRLADHPMASPRLRPQDGPAPKPDIYPSEVGMLIEGLPEPTKVTRADLLNNKSLPGILKMVTTDTLVNRYELTAVISRILQEENLQAPFEEAISGGMKHLQSQYERFVGEAKKQGRRVHLHDVLTKKEFTCAAEMIAIKVQHLVYKAKAGTEPPSRCNQLLTDAREVLKRATEMGFFAQPESSARMFVTRAQLALDEYDLSKKHTDLLLKKAEPDFQAAINQVEIQQQNADESSRDRLKWQSAIEREILAFAHTGLGCLWYTQRKFGQALDAFETCVFNIHQYSPHVLWFIALCHQALGDTEKAMQALAEVLKKDPNHAEAVAARLSWSTTSTPAGRTELMKKVYDRASKDPVCAQAFGDLAFQAVQNFDNKDEKAIEKSLKDIESRLQQSLSTTKLNSDKAETLFQLGQVAQKRKKFDEAIQYFTQATDIRGDHQRALMGLYHCNRVIGKPFFARSALLKLRDMIPHDVEIMRELVFTFTECKDWREALKACDGFLTYARNSGDKNSTRAREQVRQAEVEVKSLRASVFSQMRDEHDKRSALEQYERILQEHYPMPKGEELDAAKRVNAERRRERIEKLQVDKQKVMEEYDLKKRKAVEEKAKPPVKAEFQAREEAIERHIENEKANEKQFSYWDYLFDQDEKALRQHPDLARSEYKLWNDVAHLHFHFNHLQLASKSMEKAQVKKMHGGQLTQEDEAVLWYNQAVVFENLGELKQARRCLDQSLSVNPTNDVAQLMHKRLAVYPVIFGNSSSSSSSSKTQFCTPEEADRECRSLVKLCTSKKNPDPQLWLLVADIMASTESSAAIDLIEKQMAVYDSEAWELGREPYLEFQRTPEAISLRKKQRGDLYVHLGNLYLEEADVIWMRASSEQNDAVREELKLEALDLFANAEVAYGRSLDDYGEEWPESAATAKNGLGMLLASDLSAKSGKSSQHLKEAINQFLNASKQKNIDPHVQVLIRVNLAHTMLRKDSSTASARFALKKYLNALKHPALENNVRLLNACALAYARDNDLDKAIELLAKAQKIAEARSGGVPDIVTCYNMGVLMDAKQQHIFQKNFMKGKAEFIGMKEMRESYHCKEDAIRNFNRVKRWGERMKDLNEGTVGPKKFLVWGLDKTTKKDRARMLQVTAKRLKILKPEFKSMKADYEKAKERHETEQSRIAAQLNHERDLQKKEAEKRTKQEQDRLDREEKKRQEREQTAEEMYMQGREQLQQITVREEDGDDKKKELDKNLQALVDDTEMEQPALPFGRGRRPGVPLTEEEKKRRAELKAKKAAEKRAERGPREPRQRRERPVETEEQKAERRKAKADRRNARNLRDDVDNLQLEAAEDEFEMFHAELDVTKGAGNVEDAAAPEMNMEDVDQFLADEAIDFADMPEDDDSRKKKKKKDKKDKKRGRDDGDDEEGGKKKKKKKKDRDGNKSD
ncbi:unnamed protein product [Amoebophrya sp. A120]|nr:unnamed protein product [Amoebophrya sp. A120]|eukprot:GSA120T00006619001.1